MIKHEFYDGILYQIEYQPNLSDNEFSYDEELNVYVFIIVTPYDD